MKFNKNTVIILSTVLVTVFFIALIAGTVTRKQCEGSQIFSWFTGFAAREDGMCKNFFFLWEEGSPLAMKSAYLPAFELHRLLGVHSIALIVVVMLYFIIGILLILVLSQHFSKMSIRVSYGVLLLFIFWSIFSLAMMYDAPTTELTNWEFTCQELEKEKVQFLESGCIIQYYSIKNKDEVIQLCSSHNPATLSQPALADDYARELMIKRCAEAHDD